MQRTGISGEHVVADGHMCSSPSPTHEMPMPGCGHFTGVSGGQVCTRPGHCWRQVPSSQRISLEPQLIWVAQRPTLLTHSPVAQRAKPSAHRTLATLVQLLMSALQLLSMHLTGRFAGQEIWVGQFSRLLWHVPSAQRTPRQASDSLHSDTSSTQLWSEHY